MARDEQVNNGQILQSFIKMAEKILGKKSELPEESAPVPKAKLCPGCFISLDEIQTDGKLNCLQCYSCFGEEIITPLEGKFATKTKKKKKKITYDECVKYLEHSLKTAIKKENYETASLIRDALKEIENLNTNHEVLQKELETAIKEENFEKATEVQQKMEQLIKKCSMIQKRFQD